MKKIVLFLGIIIVSLSMISRAYAESLNEYELAIIEAAGEIYEYDGISYKVDQKYINQLVDYLSQDSIDITEGDKELLIQLAYDNIETGIKDGYLKPIDELNNQGKHNDRNMESAEDTINDAMESVGKDLSDIKSHMPSVIAEDGNQDYKSINSYNLDENSMEDRIIKQTGYNLNGTLYAVIGIVSLMIIGIYITVKNDYFAHTYE